MQSNMFGCSNRTSLNLGELASSPMPSSSSATAGISSAGSLLQSEREAVIGDIGDMFVESVEVVHNDGRLLVW